MHPRAFLEAHLDAVERAIRLVCAQASLRGADADDFRSEVMVALFENDCAIVAKCEKPESFGAYITVVVRRMLVERQRATRRWYASAAAQRLGDAGVLLERLIVREGRPFDEAIAIVRREHPEVPASALASLAASLPERAPRLQLVTLSEEDEERVAGAEEADARVLELDRAHRSQRASEVVQETMRAMTSEDRMILRLRFAKQTAISDIARMLGVPQRPLYRRLEALLVTLRRALESAGLDARAAADLIGAPAVHLNFDLARKSGPAPPSISTDGAGGSA